ncbi:MAG: L,D-transpeptidase [Gloeocapsa sp. UFS-A4-WI-NPMV-4B04]|nr:L,D-transpeptidase [Gloeocapsa sp. UFS-A4-WI-NPMV-4B04]
MINKHRSKDKLLARLILLSFIAAVELLGIQQQAASQIAPTGATTQTQSPASEKASLATSTQDTRLVIKLRDRRVYVYRNDQLKTSYPIAVGKAGWETPKGSFKVIEMQQNPAWQHPWKGTIIPPGPENPLGARWIGFWTDGKNLIGFHGTPQESLVGQAVSHGCIRMRNKDVLALYAQVSVGTPVTVEP